MYEQTYIPSRENDTGSFLSRYVEFMYDTMAWPPVTDGEEKP